MATDFVALARRELGYTVTLRIAQVPSSQLFSAIDAQFRARAKSPNLLMVESGWVDTLASPKWAKPLNGLIAQRPELDVAWFAPVVRAAYQAFPSGSRNRWAMPLDGDTLALFIRRDMLDRPGEAEAFATRFGRSLPRSWDALAAMDWAGFLDLLTFFTRPEQNLYGLGSPWARDDAFVVSASASFIYGSGGTLWRESGGQVEGVLDTQANAAALATYRDLLRFQPKEALSFDGGGLQAAFARGELFSMLYWTGAGPDLLGSALRDQVVVVPPPAFPRPEGEKVRPYASGGQCWMLNDFSDDTQDQVAADFLAWWYRPETMLDFACRGGNPCDLATVSRPDFDLLQPWFRAYRTMLPRSEALWRDPNFPELMAMQRDALAIYVAGRGDDARQVLNSLACRQQRFLFEQGSAEQPAGERCAAP